ncbi:MAG: deoxyribonuclease V [Cyanobacteria bacterium]|nr:deoxyribonuclease V [Cyanobacteriota bacterium]
MEREQGAIAWPRTAAEARAQQETLRPCARLVDDAATNLGAIAHVAGVDVGFEDHYAIARAAVAVLNFPALELVDWAIARRPTPFPYVPGLLSFREVPVILDALAKVSVRPDVILCDGQGYAHPRRFGLACHLGVLLDVPTLGAAKSRLLGEHDPLGGDRGAYQPLRDRGEIIGAVLRTRTDVKPLYVSPGHRLSLDRAIALTLACTRRYRLPETTRWADKLASNRGNILETLGEQPHRWA